MKRNRKFLLTGLLCFCMAFACGGLLKINLANAKETNISQEMLVKSASLRLADDNYSQGVRFTVVVKKSYYDANSSSKFGVLLIDDTLLSDNDLVYDTQYSQKEELVSSYWKETTIDDVQYMQANIFVYDIEPQYYSNTIVTRVYMENNGEYTYSQKTGASLAWVASQIDTSDLTQDEIDALNDYRKCTATFYVNGVPTTVNYCYGDKLEEPNEIAPQGYTVDGWYNKTETLKWNFEEDTIKSNVNLYIKLTPETNTQYKVKHYQQNVNNNEYTLVDTDELTGTTDTDTNAVAKTYEGFKSANSFEQIKIAGNGESVVNIYYDRQKFNITFKDYNGAVIDTTSYKYGAKVSEKQHSTLAGYTFTWDKTVVETVTADAEYNEVKTANTNTQYKVLHYKQDVNTDGFVLADTDNLTGTTDSPVNATAKTYNGFTEDVTNTSRVASGTVKGNGSLELKLYYTRDNILKVRGITYEDDSYTVTGFGNNVPAYNYTSDNVSDVIVYSVKVKTSGVPTEYLCSSLGVAITDNSDVITDNKKYKKAIQLGFSQHGLVSYTNIKGATASMYRRIDVPESDRWNNSSFNANVGLTANNLERTLTVVLFADKLFMYVDGNLINQIAITNTAYFNTAFGANGQYNIGLNAVNIDKNAKTVQFQVLKEYYGESALDEIRNNNEIYGWQTKWNFSGDELNELHGEDKQLLMTKNEDGSYKQNGVYGVKGYYYLDGKASSVVLSATVSVNSVPDVNANDVYSSGVGFTICSDNLNNNTTKSYQFYATGDSLQGFPNFTEGTFAVKAGSIFTNSKLSVKMTLIVYEGKLHLFIDDNEVMGNMCYSIGGGTRYSLPIALSSLSGMAGTSEFRVGFATHRLGSCVANITDVVYKTNEDAISEVNSNKLYNVSLNGIVNNNMTVNNGVYTTAKTGWASSNYAYTSLKFSDTAVYSVKISATGFASISGNEGYAGIIFSNGTIMADGEKISRDIPNDTIYSAMIGFRSTDYTSLITARGPVNQSSDNSQNARKVIGYGACPLCSGENVELTVVYSNDKLYVYVNGIYQTSISIDSDTLVATSATTDNTYGFNLGDELTFGVQAFNNDKAITFTVLKELYGEEAVADIATNYSEVA